MAVTMNWYGAGLTGLLSATAARRVDWAGDTIKVALTASGYTPNQDTHAFFSDITNELAAGGNYSAGGVALSGKSVSYDTATNQIRLLAATAVWTNATFTARRAVVYKDTGSAATSPLLGYEDFGADQSVAGANFSLAWDATGVLRITAS